MSDTKSTAVKDSVNGYEEAEVTKTALSAAGLVRRATTGRVCEGPKPQILGALFVRLRLQKTQLERLPCNYLARGYLTISPFYASEEAYGFIPRFQAHS